ncbi:MULTISPECIES: cyclophilin-like fold protein [Lactiplantibacillus]|uniref:cyclophilin-like fold protein n=1 Tax=Lactiplantibacillus TaxID=2767842 RepID=UPI001C1FB0DB|nr:MULTISPECIES: cyclophilin-like fold protein [Lactiplantibacillus]MBU7447677.1 hypothetical protein [Lactiplantibacillus sp. 7.2.4]MBU7479566.1 hypothetical protein [Lactiplantibacillus pentosus]MBU7504065.1 hypothetical protein [Lactiplantibacillus pentosus]MDY1545279.1 cyclophilin-like fold protein [Lactiplantibacillus pentosus]
MPATNTANNVNQSPLVAITIDENQVKKIESNKTKSSTDDQQVGQRITVTINGHQLAAHLNRSSAAKAFARELPTTLSFRDYADFPEKIADLHHALPTTGMPSGHAGNQGAIGYWSPDQRIVFYWGTESYYEGIHIIGHFDSQNYRQVIKNMGNHVRVRIARSQS